MWRRKLLLSESREGNALPKLPLQTIVDFAQPVQPILQGVQQIPVLLQLLQEFWCRFCTKFKRKGHSMISILFQSELSLVRCQMTQFSVCDTIFLFENEIHTAFSSPRLLLTDLPTCNSFNYVPLEDTTGFYMAKLDEICYQVCFSSCRDWYLTRQNPEFQNPAIGGV